MSIHVWDWLMSCVHVCVCVCVFQCCILWRKETAVFWEIEQLSELQHVYHPTRTVISRACLGTMWLLPFCSPPPHPHTQPPTPTPFLVVSWNTLHTFQAWIGFMGGKQQRKLGCCVARLDTRHRHRYVMQTYLYNCQQGVLWAERSFPCLCIRMGFLVLFLFFMNCIAYPQQKALSLSLSRSLSRSLFSVHVCRDQNHWVFGSGVAQWLKGWACERRVAGLSPGNGSRGFFFS